MIAIRKPRPPAGDTEAWEDPSVTEVTPGGSVSVVGGVGIWSVSIGGIGLVRRERSPARRPRELRRTFVRHEQGCRKSVQGREGER
jgi:predicted secreted protein